MSLGEKFFKDLRKSLEDAGELEPRLPTDEELFPEIARVLAIPRYAEKDWAGRGIGDDWLLADLGVLGDVHYYVTTDSVHASEIAGMNLLDPDTLAAFLAGQINASWRRYLRKRLPSIRKRSLIASTSSRTSLGDRALLRRRSCRPASLRGIRAYRRGLSQSRKVSRRADSVNRTASLFPLHQRSWCFLLQQEV